MRFKLGMKVSESFCAVYEKTVEDFEDKVSSMFDQGWSMNGNTIIHKNGGYTKPMKKIELKVDGV